MKTIGSFDAKTHLSKILDDVSKGENYIITKHGKPMAELRPVVQVEDFDWNERKDFLKSLRQRIKSVGKIDTEKIKTWRDEGRK